MFCYSLEHITVLANVCQLDLENSYMCLLKESVQVYNTFNRMYFTNGGKNLLKVKRFIVIQLSL